MTMVCKIMSTPPRGLLPLLHGAADIVRPIPWKPCYYSARMASTVATKMQELCVYMSHICYQRFSMSMLGLGNCRCAHRPATTLLPSLARLPLRSLFGPWPHRSLDGKIIPSVERKSLNRAWEARGKCRFTECGLLTVLCCIINNYLKEDKCT